MMRKMKMSEPARRKQERKAGEPGNGVVEPSRPEGRAVDRFVQWREQKNQDHAVNRQECRDPNGAVGQPNGNAGSAEDRQMRAKLRQTEAVRSSGERTEICIVDDVARAEALVHGASRFWQIACGR
jgi:hypothetical protein